MLIFIPVVWFGWQATVNTKRGSFKKPKSPYYLTEIESIKYALQNLNKLLKSILYMYGGHDHFEIISGSCIMFERILQNTFHHLRFNRESYDLQCSNLL